jgi:hypothetical protein
MELHRSCQVLLLGIVLSPAACLGQAAAAQPELASPSAATESGGGVDTNTCSAISVADSGLGLVSKLCELALAYRHQLPDFIAQQTTTTNQGASTSTITAQVTFRQGQEHYSQVTINGRHVESNSLTSALPKNIRFSSTGEFGSLLVDLFTSAGAADFKFRKEGSLRGVAVAIYDFHLPAAKNTFWTVRGPDRRILKPEFRGELWLDQLTGRPLREELEPVNLPASSGIAAIKTITDYALTSVSDIGTFLLPVKSESGICFWGSHIPCVTNVLVFHDYRKFAATSRIVEANPEP